MRFEMEGFKVIAAAVLLFAAVSAHATTPSAGYFIYDESGHLLGEYDANGNAVQEHIYVDDRPVAVSVTANSTTTLDYVTTDQLDTPRDITDGSGAVIWNWDSDPFGNGQPTGSITYNLRLPGQYYDAETGHNYNYFRDYDPTTGRYIESDPTGLDGGLNTYIYTDDNPIDEYDPTGTDGFEITPEGVPVYVPTMPSSNTTQLAQALTNASNYAAYYVAASFDNLDSELVDSLTPAGPSICLMGGHKNGKRPSTKDKHQEGDSRRGTDYGGEKADKGQGGPRRPPRIRPPGTKGPYPPSGG